MREIREGLLGTWPAVPTITIPLAAEPRPGRCSGHRSDAESASLDRAASSGSGAAPGPPHACGLAWSPLGDSRGVVASPGGADPDQAPIRQLASEFNLIGPLNTSALTGEGIAQLRHTLAKVIDWDALPKIASTEMLQRIRAFLLHEKESGRQLSTADQLFRAFRTHADSDREVLRTEFDTAIRLLSSSGLITTLSFAGLVLLQPRTARALCRGYSDRCPRGG